MVEPHRHDGGERLIGALLRIPAEEITRRVHAAMSERYPVLTLAHMGVFQHIDHPPFGTRQTDLAARMRITKQACGELVDILERHGFAERRPDPGDRRVKLACLTARGWELHELASEVVSGIEREWAALMGATEFDRLKALLGELHSRARFGLHA
jgi:DNA-binding MarR family transcriptional regulator